MYKAGKQSLVQTRNPRFLDKEWLHRSGVFKLEKDTTDIYMTVNDKEKNLQEVIHYFSYGSTGQQHSYETVD